MPEQVISCPKCGTKIPISEAFTHEIESKLHAQFEADIKAKEREHQQTLEAKQREFREAFDRQVVKLEAQAQQKAQETLSVEMKDLKEQLAEKSQQLNAAKDQEVELRKRQRVLEEKERNLRLEVERTLDSERKKIWEDAAGKASEEQRMKLLEKEKQVSDLLKQLDEMKRKAEVTSQQMQGEVQEIELESILSQQFKRDSIEPVPKGVHGADIIQRVKDESGNACGNIIWESKRTKAWSDGWVQKLKDDQRLAKAEVAVLVTSVLPKEVNRFGMYDGIWVADFASAVGLATALRLNLMQVAYASKSLLGKNEKMEIIYQYLRGPQFKQRIEAIAESFIAMKNDLDAERRAMERMWAKREMQINRVMNNTTGLHGDLQGIIGSSLPEVKILELPTTDDRSVD